MMVRLGDCVFLNFINFEQFSHITRVVYIGTSSKKSYPYFVPTAHSGTFEIASKDRNV